MEIILALGGGGIKGVAHIGLLDCLDQAGIKVRAIAGSSIGGLIGAVYAAGYSPKEITAILESLNPNRFYTRLPGDGPSLLGYTGLAEALVEMLGNTEFGDLKIPFACSAVNIRNRQEIILAEGRVVDAVLATIAVPGIFPPKIRGEEELIDGAILNPVPVGLARSLNPGLPVVAVVLNPEQSKWHVTQFASFAPINSLHIPSPLVESFSRLRLAKAVRIFLQATDISAMMLTELRLEKERPDLVIRPDVHAYAMLDTVLPRELIKIGYAAAERSLPEIHHLNSWTNRFMRKIRYPGRAFEIGTPQTIGNTSRTDPESSK